MDDDNSRRLVYFDLIFNIIDKNLSTTFTDMTRELSKSRRKKLTIFLKKYKNIAEVYVKSFLINP